MSNWFETKTIWKGKIKELEAIKRKMERVVELAQLGIFKVNVGGQSNKEKKLQGKQWK